MKIERVNQQHLELINEWCAGRQMSAFVDGWLPEHGWIVSRSSDPRSGIIAAFLYLTDSRLSFLECVISNPESTPDERSLGMAMISQASSQVARAKGYRWMQGQTKLGSVRDTAKKNGWHATNFEYCILLNNLETK